MYISDVESRLNKHLIRLGNCDYYPASLVKKELERLSDECIRWSEEDFKTQAINHKGNEWEEYYDEEQFSYALCQMTYKHDASIGITWDTVDYYLDLYCKKQKVEDIYNSFPTKEEKRTNVR